MSCSAPSRTARRGSWQPPSASLLGALDGSCRTPIGAYAQLRPDNTVHLTGLVARADGSFLLRETAEGPAADAARLGRELGDRLRREAPADILA